MIKRLVSYELVPQNNLAFKFGSLGFALARFLLINYHFKFKLSLNEFDIMTRANELSVICLVQTPKGF